MKEFNGVDWAGGTGKRLVFMLVLQISN